MSLKDFFILKCQYLYRVHLKKYNIGRKESNLKTFYTKNKTYKLRFGIFEIVSFFLLDKYINPYSYYYKKYKIKI